MQGKHPGAGLHVDTASLKGRVLKFKEVYRMSRLEKGHRYKPV